MSRAPTALANRGVAAAPASASGACRASAASLARSGVRDFGERGREDDRVGPRGIDCFGQGVERRIRTEVVDPPPPAVQHDAEDHQR
jgi:hypothetical protein